MLARTRTLALHGVDALPVDVEIDIHRGLPAFSLVGLPDAAVRESRERVRAAIVNSGFEFPLQRITASLAPADLRKAGPGFDLAIAASILIASGQVPAEALGDWWIAGELALDGSIRPLRGVLAMAERTQREGGAGIAVAAANAGEARLVDGIAVAAVTVARGPLGARGRRAAAWANRRRSRPHRVAPLPDLSDLKGQQGLRRGLEIAAAGGHGALVDRPAGRRQVDGGAAAAVDPAAARPRRGDRGDEDRQRRRPPGPGRSARPAPVQGAASHDLAGRPRRRRLPAASRRDHPGPSRGALPRRARGVLALEPRSAQAADRGRRSDDLARPGLADVPGAVSSCSPRPTPARAGTARDRRAAPATPNGSGATRPG